MIDDLLWNSDQYAMNDAESHNNDINEAYARGSEIINKRGDGMNDVNVEFYRNGLTVRINGNTFEEIQDVLNKAVKWANDNPNDSTSNSAGSQVWTEVSSLSK